MQMDAIALFENILADKENSVKALLTHPDYNAAEGEFMVPLGLMDNGQLFSEDIAKISHMLVGGTTGSGKTTFAASSSQ